MVVVRTMRGSMLALRIGLRMVRLALTGALCPRTTLSTKTPGVTTTAGTLGVRRTGSSATTIRPIEVSVLSKHVVRFIIRELYTSSMINDSLKSKY